MNSWLWNQGPQQQRLSALFPNPIQRDVQQVPRFRGNSLLGFHPYQPHGFVRGHSTRPRFQNVLMPHLPQQRSIRPPQQKTFQSQDGLLPTTSPPQLNVAQSSSPSTSHQTSYQVNEIKQARTSLSTYLDQQRMGTWRSLTQDNQANIWEGEAGMMEHCTQPFPMPAQGEVKPGVSVWCPTDEDSEGHKLSVSETDGVESEHPPPEVVSVSDEDDSDVQVLNSSPASVILLSDKPTKPTKNKKRKKRARYFNQWK